MDKTCRICAKKSHNLTKIFTIYNDIPLLDMIQSICPVKIEINDNLPSNICLSCLKVIKNAFDLRKTSLQSDFEFRSSFKDDESCGTSNYDNENEEIVPINEIALTIKKENDPLFENENYGITITNLHDEIDEKPQDDSREEENSDGEENLEVFTPKEINQKVKDLFDRPDKFGKWRCKLCDKSYAGTVFNLKDHLVTAHKKISFPLSMRSKVFSRKKRSKNSEDEITSYEPRIDKKMRMGSSDSASNDIKELNNKVKNYFDRLNPEDKSKNLWRCKMCCKKYSGSLYNLKEHISSAHKALANKIGVEMVKKNKNSNSSGKHYGQICRKVKN